MKKRNNLIRAFMILLMMLSLTLMISYASMASNTGNITIGGITNI